MGNSKSSRHAPPGKTKPRPEDVYVCAELLWHARMSPGVVRGRYFVYWRPLSGAPEFRADQDRIFGVGPRPVVPVSILEDEDMFMRRPGPCTWFFHRLRSPETFDVAPLEPGIAAAVREAAVGAGVDPKLSVGDVAARAQWDSLASCLEFDVRTGGLDRGVIDLVHLEAEWKTRPAPIPQWGFIGRPFPA